ncbi:MLP-like protein 34 isoform X1 [Neltuma alba]|uniref:MLP-like protein 34 isoform X1 n=1 Tax=Neltuma alba TaxID=207710 RepID=UPI0010A356BF|nr:MLP-like protein 34 isoform X1 [Prosopis alba]
MSVVSSLEADLELNTSAVKFLEIFSTRIYELLTISPEIIQSIEIVEGEWGTSGFVFLSHYTLLDGTAQVAKLVVESINLVDLSMTFRVIEGDLLDVYNSFMVYLKLTPNLLSGSVLHWTFEYEKPSSDTADPTSLMETAIQVSKDVDAYVSNLI